MSKFQIFRKKKDCIIYLDAIIQVIFFKAFLGINLTGFKLNGKVVLEQKNAAFTKKNEKFWAVF